MNVMFEIIPKMRTYLDKGPFKYYVSKEVGKWGQKMAIFADLLYYLCWRRWVGGPKKAKNMLKEY